MILDSKQVNIVNIRKLFFFITFKYLILYYIYKDLTHTKLFALLTLSIEHTAFGTWSCGR